jgi:hypothetical protein
VECMRRLRKSEELCVSEQRDHGRKHSLSRRLALV